MSEMTTIDPLGDEGTRIVRRLPALAGLVALPLILYLVLLESSWREGDLGVDFVQTLLPAAERIASGESPYPDYGYPPLVAFALVPLSVVPAAEIVWVAVLALAVVLSLRVLGVRDWRCYGAAFLWGPTFHGVQTGNVTVLLLVAAALAWRYRESTWGAASSAGLAIATKILCWPLLVWLASTRRVGTALRASLVAGGVTLALWATLGFSGLLDYPAGLDRLEAAQAPESYTVRALLVDAGVVTQVGQAAWALLAAGVVLGCAVAGRRGDDRLSFALAVVACVVASPIVWLHSFALLLAPIALYRPRFDAVWLFPAVLWFASGNGNGEPWQTALTLAVAGTTVVLVLRDPGRHQVPAPS